MLDKIVTAYDINDQPHEVKESELIPTTRVYGIYIQDHKLLMVRDPQGTFWELPGGGVEDDENYIEALKREFKEETGLNITVSEHDLVDNFVNLFYSQKEEAWKAHRRFYLVQDATGDLLVGGNGSDVAELRFVEVQELANLSVKPEIQQVLSQNFTS